MAYSGAYQPGGPPPAVPAPRPTGQGGPPRPFFSAPSAGKDPIFSALMKKMKAIDLESDDLLMLLILYLMYRESGDRELLIMMGAMLLG